VHPPEELKLIYLGCTAPPAATFGPSERSCPGNKGFLLSFLDRVVRAKVWPVSSALDLFAGTGTVAAYFAEAGARVIANDLRPASYVSNCAFLLSNSDQVGQSRLRELLVYLAALPPRSGALARRCAPVLGAEAAGRVQACRTTLAEMRSAGRVTKQEDQILVASLVQAVDKLAGAREQGGRLPLLLPQYREGRENQVYQRDARQLVREVQAEVIYLDPPLRPEPPAEADRLALLDEVARGEGRASGEAAARQSLAPLADWTETERAVRALADLVARVQGRHLFLSYSSEGVIPNRTIWDLLKTRGRPECFELEHAVVSAQGSGRVVERLFYCALAEN
jgi:adenine-specific DNA-methyltransferase